MMSGALMADAAIGNVQERTLKSFNALNTEMVGSFHLFFFRQIRCLVVFRNLKLIFTIVFFRHNLMLHFFY